MRTILFIFFLVYHFNVKSQDDDTFVQSSINFDLSFDDIYICSGDSVMLTFPQGDFSSYYDFSWLINGNLYSEDSTIIIYNEGLYELELYGVDTLIGTFELNFYETFNYDLFFQTLIYVKVIL